MEKDNSFMYKKVFKLSNFVGLLIMTIGLKKISVRTSVATGGGLIALSYLLSAFITDIRLFYILQGFVHGKLISITAAGVVPCGGR